MTLSQSLNLHSFVVFITLAMGISYVVFNSRQVLSLGKILTILILVVPFVVMGFERGHVVDIGLGVLIGWITARGGLGQFVFVLDGWSSVFGKKQPSQSQEQADSKNRNNQQQAEEEFKRRQRQAEQDRQQSASGRSGQKNQQDKQQKSSQGQQSQTKTEYERPVERKKTPLEQAYYVLGITSETSYKDAKKMYRKLISRHHEDNLYNMPESEISYSLEKAKEINVAWDRIKKARGWK